MLATPIDPPQAAIDFTGPETFNGAVTIKVNSTPTGLSPDADYITIPNGYLVATINYTLQVRATNVIGDSPWSEATSWQMCASVPPETEAPDIISVTTDSVTFSWANSTNAWTNGTFREASEPEHLPS